jgi:hypothetical protein
MTTEQATKELREMGAELAKMEDRQGDTKSGWWLDGVYLGKKATDALEAVQG